MAALYGLIGYPLTHSFSPGFFNKKFNGEGINAVYDTFPIGQISDFPALLKAHTGLRGLNVTIPYKQAIMPYLDELDVVAEQAGAVNCIAFSNGKTKGYNTDVTGFERSLLPLLQPQHTHALVLGTGGASKAVVFVLERLGIAYKMVSRNNAAGHIIYKQLTDEIAAAHKLIINTTPVGMFPHVNGLPALPYAAIGKDHLLYDLIYNPAETAFLHKGKAAGAAVKNGLEMLHLQAEAAWEIWNSK